MIRFACECGRQLQARDELAGKAASCPACGARVPIPDPAAVRPDEPPPRRAPAAVRAERPDDRDDGYDEERPRRRRRDEEDEGRPAPAATSGKATGSLVLGISSFVCLLNILTGLPAVILGLLALKDIGRSRGRLGGKGLAIGGIATGAFGILVTLPSLVVSALLIVPAVRKAAEVQVRARDGKESRDNLAKLGLAVHTYESANNRFPPAGLAQDPFTRKPRLSWRVHLLPYLGEQGLYDRFNQNEPWDGPTNKPLIGQMPKVFEVPGRPAGQGMTYYRVFVPPAGPPGMVRADDHPAFHEQARLISILDGVSNTLLIVESSVAVTWTRPDDDIPYSRETPFSRLALPKDGFNAAMADGSTRFVPANTPEASIRALITARGGEVVPPP